MHQINIESLAIEIDKFQAGLTTPIMRNRDLFKPGKANLILEIFKH